MSNLLVTIIAIALVAAAALAASYYGSASWNKGQAQAKATTMVSQREQIKTAANLYKSTVGNGVAVSSMNDLTANDLIISVPQMDDSEWQVAGDKIFLEIPADDTVAEDLCLKAFEKEYGKDQVMPAIGLCSDANPPANAVCCRDE